MADEGGVWRTISGRRVFIRDGQSLSEAMKESGKFKKEGKKKQSDEPETKERRVYGKSEGQTYQVKDSDEYELTGDKAGQTIEIPQNETGEFTVYKAPKTSGFVNGKYVSDENKNAILSDGRVVLNDHAFNNEASIQVKAMIEHETLRLSGMIKDGQYFRGTDNPQELEYLKAGTIRGSINHATGEKEGGLSVWESPKYSFKYMYRVTGEVVGIGSDGEPLLKPSSVSLSGTKRYSIRDYKNAMEKGKSIFCETYGWTEEQYDSAVNGSIRKRQRL